MVTLNNLLFHLKDEIGEIIYNSQKPEFYREILEKKTLMLWATYFPKIVKAIMIREADGVPMKHPQTGVVCRSGLYKIPKNNPDDVYISYEKVYYQGNLNMNQASSSLPAMNNMIGLISQSLPNNQFYGIERYSFEFSPPDLLRIEPIPMRHIDFSINMQRIPRLTEIPVYYLEPFKNLFIADVKISLYNKYKHLAKGGSATYQGLEITTDLISDLESGKDERKDSLELFEKNYWKDPSRYESLLFYDSP
ncbi:MAG: hypothetical protein ACRC5M_04750 [Anaeroplasmataceae bacterium]